MTQEIVKLNIRSIAEELVNNFGYNVNYTKDNRGSEEIESPITIYQDTDEQANDFIRERALTQLNGRQIFNDDVMSQIISDCHDFALTLLRDRIVQYINQTKLDNDGEYATEEMEYYVEEEK